MTQDSSVLGNPEFTTSAFSQDSLFCYADALQDEVRQNLVCTMRIVPEEEDVSENSNFALFSDSLNAEAKKPRTGSARVHHRFYDVSDLARLEHTLAGATDTYIAQATFDQHKRREVNVSSIQTLFVDLDIYNVGISPEDAMSRITSMFDSIGIPDPTITTVSSGRGLYVKLPLEEAVHKKDLMDWKTVQQGLVNFLSPLGADAKVKDAARVLRAVGTINGKNGSPVEVIHQASRKVCLKDVNDALEKAGLFKETAFRKARGERTSKSRTSLDAIDTFDGLGDEERSWAHALEPFSLKKFQELITEKHSASYGKSKNSMLRRKYQQFCWSALADIDQVAKMRGGRFGRGTRDASVFWSLVLLAQAELVTPENFWPEALALAARTVGRYDPITDGSLSTLFGKLCIQVSQNANSMYVATRDRLMDELGITSDEERRLSVLVSRAEYGRRTYRSQRLVASMDDLRIDERRFMAKLVRYIDQEKLRANNECRTPQLSDNEIAGKLRVHPRTIKRYMGRLALYRE